MRFFSIVDEHAARHPVARAIQRDTIVRSMRDFLLVVYTLEDGTEQGASVQAAAKAIAVGLRLLELQGLEDTPECRVLRGGMSAMLAASQRGFVWRSVDAPAVDAALTRVVEVFRKARAVDVTEAWAFVAKLEREAVAA